MGSAKVVVVDAFFRRLVDVGDVVFCVDDVWRSVVGGVDGSVECVRENGGRWGEIAAPTYCEKKGGECKVCRRECKVWVWWV